MKAKEFIETVKEMLGIDEDLDKGKRKSVQRLLEKLNKKRTDIVNQSKSTTDDEESKLELGIIELKIAKGNKILKKINDKKAEK